MEFYTISKIGHDHILKGHPCQDAFHLSYNNQSIIMTIADGHGGEAYCRSDVGASIACLSSLEATKTEERSGWAIKIKRKYDMLVQQHLKENPLSDEEKKKIGARNSSIAYGATFLFTLIGDSSVSILQLGDGQIHVLGADGTFLPALEKDEDCVENFTSSLCYPEEEALHHFRAFHYSEKPAAVFMFSDGYKSIYSRPYKLAATVMENGDISAVAKKGERGDDQTILIAFDRQQFDTEKFRDGFKKTLTDYYEEIVLARKREKKEKIEQEMLEIKEFLQLAENEIEKCKQRNENDRVNTLIALMEKKRQAISELNEQLKEIDIN